jgi:recombination protein RecR
MTSQPTALLNLIDRLARLPTIGRKTARRLALHLIQSPKEEAGALVKAITAAREAVGFCSTCGSLTEVDPCRICSDPKRDKRTLLVVEEPGAVQAIERSGNFRGLYHVLMGTLASEGEALERLRLKELIKRVKKEDFKEVILATNPSMEGEATAAYINQLLQDTGVNVSRIARGLPAGGDIELADQVTISDAIDGRRIVEDRQRKEEVR